MNEYHVYRGRDCVGRFTFDEDAEREARAHAYDRHDNLIGTFATYKAALAAVAAAYDAPTETAKAEAA